jgi:hypothetical protein
MSPMIRNLMKRMGRRGLLVDSVFVSAITRVMLEGGIAKSCLANSLDGCTQPRRSTQIAHVCHKP